MTDDYGFTVVEAAAVGGAAAAWITARTQTHGMIGQHSYYSTILADSLGRPIL